MTKPRIVLASAITLLILLVVVPPLLTSSAQEKLRERARAGERRSMTPADLPKELDVRGANGVAKGITSRQPNSLQMRSLALLQKQVNGELQVKYNGLTATPRHMFSYGGYLTAPSTEKPETIALNFIKNYKQIFRFSASDLSNLKLKTRTTVPDLGTTIMVFAQQVNGLPVHRGEVLVNVNRAGQILSVGSESFPQMTITNSKTITPEQAIEAAASALGVEKFSPKLIGAKQVLRTFGDLTPEYSKGTEYDGGGVFTDNIVVTEVAFPLGDTARIAYQFTLTTPQYYGIMWENFVDAQTGEILRRHSLTSFQNSGGGQGVGRRATFRPDIQDLLESRSTTGAAARGKVFDGMPTTMSGVGAFGRSTMAGTPPTYAPDTTTTGNGRGFRQGLVFGHTQDPLIYNLPLGQVLRGFPDATNPTPQSPYGWFYLPTDTGGVEITAGDANRATTRAIGYNISAEAMSRNVAANSPVGDKSQPFSATTTPVTPVTLADGRNLSSVFQSNYTEGNNLFVADDRQNDNETTQGIKGYSPTRQFTESRFDFLNSYEFGGVDAGGTPFYPPSADPDVYPGTLTLFYYNNLIHDYLYSIGFTESLFNFQQDNFGKGGAGKDGVSVNAQDGSGTDNANFGAPADGSTPRMQMFLFTDGGFRRSDGDLDWDVVAHEAYHGVSNRSVGKGQTDCLGVTLVGESGGQGEGWSDYNASSLADDDAEGEYVTGIFDTAIRRLPVTNYRWSYGALNGNLLNRRDSRPPLNVQPPDAAPGGVPFEVHDIGEVWSAVLWDMRELLIVKQNSSAIFFDGTRRFDANQATGTGTQFYIGYRRVRSVDANHPIDYRASFNTNDPATIKPAEHLVRPGAIAAEIAALGNRQGPIATSVSNGARLSDTLVMRGMQLSPCNPSFVDSRDSILLADRELTGGENQALIWRAFASHGVGMGASSTSGAGDDPGSQSAPTIVEDFTVPQGVSQCETLGPLAVPTFTLSNTTPNTVTILINNGVAITGANKYIISRSENGGAFASIAEIPASQTTFNDAGRTLGQTYSYQVRASRDAASNCVSSSDTKGITVNIGAVLPVSPVFSGVDQVVDPGSCNFLVVTWNPAISVNPLADIVYDVFRTDKIDNPGNTDTTEATFAPSAANRITPAGGVRGVSFVDNNNGTGLKTNKVYYYIVQARDLNNGRIDTNNVGNTHARFNAPTAPAVTATPVFARETYETAAANTRFVPPLVDSGNAPNIGLAAWQRVTNVSLGNGITTSTMYAPDFDPTMPPDGTGAPSNITTQIGPLTLTPNSIMEFDHKFTTEASFDGGVLEIKLGAPFTAGEATPYPDNVTTFDLGYYIVEGGYTGKLDGTLAAGVPLSTLQGRLAYTGSKGFHHVKIPLEAFATGGTNNAAGAPVYIRFRMTSDAGSNAGVGSGWYVDNLVVNNLNPAACAALNISDVLISEFRLRGKTGSADEFVELYNNTDKDLTAFATDGSAGWSVVSASSDGATPVVLGTVPTGTKIPARGHYLVANAGYSLGNGTQTAGGYPAGNGTNASADKSYTTDAADNTGVAVFTTTTPANFVAGNRLDAAGFSSLTGPLASLFRNGTGIAPVTTDNKEYSFVRRMPVNGASRAPAPQNTNNNAADFVLVSTDGNATFPQAVLGAPGPENLSSPIFREEVVLPSYVDPTAPRTGGQNRIRNSADTGANANFGTLIVRRKFTNLTGNPVTRLRFRIVDITTLGSPGSGGSQASLRALDAGNVIVTLSDGVSTADIKGATLEQPPDQSSNGGGVNSSYTVVLPDGGLSTSGANQSINVQFRLGVVQSGAFRFFFAVEALP
jgi:hypothetical protein